MAIISVFWMQIQQSEGWRYNKNPSLTSLPRSRSSHRFEFCLQWFVSLLGICCRPLLLYPLDSMLGWMDRLTQLNCCSVLMMKERRTKYEKQNALCKNSHMLLILVCKSIVACYIGLPVGSVSSVCSCFEKNGLLVPHSSPRATSCLPDLLSLQRQGCIRGFVGRRGKYSPSVQAREDGI